MNHESRKPLRRRVTLLLALVAVFALALASLQQRPALATCPDAASVNMYSDATYTTLVGNCVHSCCQIWTCTGQLTNYQVIFYEVSCDFE